jgi:hypothetical protein
VSGRTFFQVPAIASQLKRIAPTRTRRLLHELVVTSPIQRHGNYLVANGCRPHACPDENFVVAVRPDDSAMALIYWNGARVETTCHSTGLQMKDLPKSAKEFFLQLHIPKENDSTDLVAMNPWLEEVVCK